ncbi:MAG TPA: hypothetical protein DCR40_15710 [Prolixibacteraceae bacterium]|nr:hypothetical protein [Prolixibacteraceae bacterium]
MVEKLFLFQPNLAAVKRPWLQCCRVLGFSWFLTILFQSTET